MSEKLLYILRKSKRAKHMRLVVHCDGSVTVTTPPWLNQSIIEKFIIDKKQWIINKINYFKGIERKVTRTFSKKDYLKYKEESRKLIGERADYFNKLYGFYYNKIYIRNQRTRWGSCSSRKNLNFNYKLIFLPQKHQDYIIVHELCHLRELNHSYRFWELVQKFIPDYLEIRKELRHHESLYRVGEDGIRDYNYKHNT